MIQKANRPSSLVLLSLSALCLACAPPGRSGKDDAGDNGGNGGNGGAGGGGSGGSGRDGSASDRPRPKRCSGGATAGFSSTDFRDPVVHCHWDGAEVMTTPMVVDVTGDGKPEVLFGSYGKMLRAISGADCKVLWEVGTEANTFDDMAVADLDGDGKPELVLPGLGTEKLFVYEGATGKLLATASSTMLRANGWQPVTVANLDGKGNPEILAGNAAFRYESGGLSVAWVEPPASGGGLVPPGAGAGAAAVADFDGDGVSEVVAHGRVLDGATGAVKLEGLRTGFYAVADIDPGSPGPEIANVYPTVLGPEGSVTVYAGLGAPSAGAVLFGPYSTGRNPRMGTPSGGAPAIADFDNDGEPEIGVAGGGRFQVYDRECAVTPRPSKCVAPGILWMSEVLDATSGVTGSTVFDFNCDGKAEVIYRDECFMRVYDGETGKVRFATTMTSGTRIEVAVVADTDGSGHAKIVIATNRRGEVEGPMIGSPPCPSADPLTKTPFTGGSQGIYILRDPLDRWAPTRRIWNQNAYHITNVNEDGTVPEKEAASWAGENSYRANSAWP